MAEILFYVLALGAIAAAGSVVLRRNPVVSTVNLVVVFFCLSGIYLLLGFPLVAAVQLLVYAGAIMVLFLFVVLLLNLKHDEEQAPLGRWLVAGVATVSLTTLLAGAALFSGETKTLESPAAALDSTASIGKELFSTYLIPFEATGILILAAIVGVLHLSRREKKGEGE